MCRFHNYSVFIQVLDTNAAKRVRVQILWHSPKGAPLKLLSAFSLPLCISHLVWSTSLIPALGQIYKDTRETP